MRFLQDPSRTPYFCPLHQSWLSQCFSPSGLPRHCPSRSSSASLCFSFPPHVHVKLRLVVFPLQLLHMSKPQKSPFLDLFNHCFLSSSSSLGFSFISFSLLLLHLLLLSQLIYASSSLLSSSFITSRPIVIVN